MSPPPGRCGPGRARISRLLALVVLICGGMVAGAGERLALAGPGGIRVASVVGHGLSVALADVSPPVAKVGTAVTVSGTVTNTGTTVASGPQVQLLLGRQGLPLRPDVAAWAKGTGSTLALADVGRQSLGAMLAPGATVHFSIVIPASAIRDPQSFAVLPMAVSASAEGSATAPSGPAATIRTFLPWVNSPKRYVPVSLAWVVPVTLDPDANLFDVGKASRTAAWAAATGPSSRAARILSADRGAPVTWVIDPAVLGPRTGAAATTSGAAGAGATGTSTAGTSTTGTSTTGTSTAGTSTAGAASPSGGRVAEPLAVRLRSATKGRPVWSLPYADPDVAALSSSPPLGGAAGPLLSASTRLASTLGRSVRNDIVWPADGLLTPARESALRALYTDAPLTAALVAGPPTNQLVNTTQVAPQKSAAGLPLLAFDPGLSAEFVAATSASGHQVARQLFLADTMALLSELPGRARSILVAAPRQYSPSVGASMAFWSAIKTAPWLASVSTTSELHQAVDAKPETSGATGAAAAAPSPLIGVVAPGNSPLNPSRLRGIRRARATIEGVSSILNDTAGFRTTWLDAETQLLSTRWRSHRGQFERLQGRVHQATDRVRKGVQVRTSDVNFFADRGFLQVTVVNDLDEPLHGVRLELTPASPKLQIQSEPALLQIDSNSRDQVRVPVKAIAAGLVPVEARLTTANGTLLGPREQMLVRVQPTGSWIYWVLGGLTLLVLLSGIVRSMRGGRRPISPAPSAAPVVPTAVPQPAPGPEGD